MDKARDKTDNNPWDRTDIFGLPAQLVHATQPSNNTISNQNVARTITWHGLHTTESYKEEDGSLVHTMPSTTFAIRLTHLVPKKLSGSTLDCGQTIAVGATPYGLSAFLRNVDNSH